MANPILPDFPQLPANLPEDWVWDQIIPPNGADIGKEAQYGYNYLMQMANRLQVAANQLQTAVESLSANKANIGPPQEHPLSLLNGFVYHPNTGYKNMFCKTQEDLVVVAFSVQKSDGGYFVTGPIAQLPEGYRANGFYCSPAVCVSGGSVATSVAQVTTQLDGTLMIQLHSSATNITQIQGVLNFFAAS